MRNIGFNTKNIYLVNNLNDNYNIDSNNKVLVKKINKRGFDDLLPMFYFIYKKYPVLNKKPILLQLSYFINYELNIYKNNSNKK